MHAILTRSARAVALLALACCAGCSESSDLTEPELPERILFQSLATGSSIAGDIYTVAPDGSDLVRLTTFGDAFAPTWSPDGTQIAFGRIGSNHNIFVMDADGANLRQVTTGSEEKMQPSWSPDGRSLIYVESSGSLPTAQMAFRTVSVNGGAVTLLASFAVCTSLSGESCEGQWPTYSPDGLSIAYVSWVPRDTDPGIRVPAVFLMRADGSGGHNLLPRGMRGHLPRWALDGSGLLFSGYSGSGLAYDVYRMHPDGSDLQRLTTSGSIGSSSLSRDGTRLVIDRSVPGGGRVLQVMGVDGSALRQPTQLPAVYPRWRP